MKYVIKSSPTLNRKARLRIFMRWFFYVLVMIFLFMLMSSGLFKGFQPPLLYALALAVAMREGEFAGSIFAIFCGLLCDTVSTGIFGFYSLWLMPCALASALLVRNLIRGNFFNHVWMTAATCFIIGFMDYLFNYLIWDKPHSEIILVSCIVLPLLVTVVLSPCVYLLVKVISIKFGEKESRELSDAVQENDDSKEKIRE